jgi:hypothetical protein
MRLSIHTDITGMNRYIFHENYFHESGIRVTIFHAFIY